MAVKSNPPITRENRSAWWFSHIKQMESYPDVSANVQIKLLQMAKSMNKPGLYRHSGAPSEAIGALKKIGKGKLKPETVTWLRTLTNDTFVMDVLYAFGEKIDEKTMIGAIAEDNSGSGVNRTMEFVIKNLMPKPSDAFYKKLIDKSSWRFMDIDNPSVALTEYALRKDSGLIRFVKNPSVVLQKIAAESNPYVFLAIGGRLDAEVQKHAEIALAKLEHGKAKAGLDTAREKLKIVKSSGDKKAAETAKTEVAARKDHLKLASKKLKTVTGGKLGLFAKKRAM